MIVLFGGTGETAMIAEALAGEDFRILVSTATDEDLFIGCNELISRRSGRLDSEGLKALLASNDTKAVVDSTHPYAVEISRLLREVCKGLSLPYVRYLRSSAGEDAEGVLTAPDHVSAAELAFSFSLPVFLTTGSRNLLPYIERARGSGIPVIARVLPRDDSREACRAAGFRDNEVVYSRGPFSEADTLDIIDEFEAGVLVTKDSGVAGGLGEKLSAARKRNCRVVMVSRPEETALVVAGTVQELIRLLKTHHR